MVRTVNRPRRSQSDHDLRQRLNESEISGSTQRSSRSQVRYEESSDEEDSPPHSKRQQSKSQAQGSSKSKNNQQPVKNKRKNYEAQKASKAKRQGLDFHIRYLQSTTHNLIPKLPLCRVIREVLQRFGDYRITATALDALQVTAETYLTALFADAYMLTIHRKRVTLEPRDITLLLYIRGSNDPGVRR